MRWHYFFFKTRAYALVIEDNYIKNITRNAKFREENNKELYGDCREILSSSMLCVHLMLSQASLLSNFVSIQSCLFTVRSDATKSVIIFPNERILRKDTFAPKRLVDSCVVKLLAPNQVSQCHLTHKCLRVTISHYFQRKGLLGRTKRDRQIWNKFTAPCPPQTLLNERVFFEVDTNVRAVQISLESLEISEQSSLQKHFLRLIFA